MPLIRTVRYRIPLPEGSPAGRIRLAVLADLHNNVFPGLKEMLEAEAPDAVLIAGDMANKPRLWRKAGFGRAYALVKWLAERYPVWYAPGNHETDWKMRKDAMGVLYLRYRQALEKKGVVFLDNRSVDVTMNGFSFTLTGLELDRVLSKRKPGTPDPITKKDLDALLGRPEEGAYHILLSHTPVFFEAYRDWGADLVFSGHLHGGMIRLPFIGGLIGAGFSLFPEYDRGLFEEDGKRMIVTTGVGTHTLPIRLFNPRELVIAELER